MSMGYNLVEIPDLSEWDWYDINLGDDGVLSADFTSALPANFLLPYPADAEDPDEEIVVKAIRVLIMDEDVPAPANCGLGQTTVDVSAAIAAATYGHWSIGFFEFNQTTEANEAYRDELKEAIYTNVFSASALNHDQDTATAGIVMGHAINTDTWVIFKKPQVFPLNIAMKVYMTEVGGTALALVSKEAWNIRIYYKKRRRASGILGRILALMRQTLSA